MSKTTTKTEKGLILHLPLRADAKPLVAQDKAVANHGVKFDAKGPRGETNGTARFDGSSWLDVPSNSALRLGSSDFTLSVSIHTDGHTDRVGDIVSKFDPVKLNGLNLGVVTQQGVSGAQSNYRNVHFGLDANLPGSTEWIDCGRPGKAMKISALAVWDGELYASTFEWEKSGRGHVYRYQRDGRWIDCGSPSKANGVLSLAEMGGDLYCTTGRYKAFGSVLPDSPNHEPGGHIYRYAGGKRWIDCGRLVGFRRRDITFDLNGYAEPGPEAQAASYLCCLKGKLYAGAPYIYGVWEYRGGKQWRELGLRHRVMGLLEHRGQLHALFNGGGDVWRYDGKNWDSIGKLEETTQTYGASMYQGKLHVATWPNALVLREDAPGVWVNTGRLGFNMEVMGMAVYNGKLYAGVLPMGDVHRYEENHWSWSGNLDSSRVILKRVWSMCVAKGDLFAGTLPSGRVYRRRQGAMATVDRSLSPGWRHIAAVRKGGLLTLYIDGKEAARSPSFNSRKLMLDNDLPLRVGTGQHAPFNGLMSDLRLYNRAVTQSEIRGLAGK